MNCLTNKAGIAALLAVLAAPPAGAAGAFTDASGTFSVTGAVIRAGAWSVPRLCHDLAGDVRTVRYTLKGSHHVAHCVPLLAVLLAAGPRINPQIKHHILQFVVIARGKDGYAVAFSLAEMQSMFGHEAVWVAWDRDGEPLSADEGPVELLVPGDVKAARWVHGLAALTVVDEARAASPNPP
ncbi:MAG: molybdopterin-dependent oxidoreductase [Armatimonadetes bacterium]|nr:molybdopterin-dependent oxidoreductase [Armatimonadota bacterium]